MNWINVKDQLPREDEILLLWVEDSRRFHSDGFRIGHYENNKFYARTGLDSNYKTVTHFKYIGRPNEN